MVCPVCGSSFSPEALVLAGKNRSYSECPACGLILLNPGQVLDEEAEKKRYLLHANTPDDSGYVGYLEAYSREHIEPHLEKGAMLLDFGCGREPVLASLLEKRGFSCACYDKYFFNDRTVLEARYDAVILLEVLEHLFDVRTAFMGFHSLLKEDGLLFIRTRLHQGDRAAFLSWWYVQDPTHVAFYSERTMKTIPAHFPFLPHLMMGDCDIIFKNRAEPA
jgi:hypothetical protein